MHANTHVKARRTLIWGFAAALSLTGLFGLSLRVSASTAFTPTEFQQEQVDRLAHSSRPGPSASGSQSGDDPNQEEEWDGLVTSLPAQGFIGLWQIAVDSTTTYTMVVDANTDVTHFDGPPALSTWIEAKGTVQPDGSLLAMRVRPDDFEGGEIVVRLQPGTDLNVFANTYDLTQIDALLASAGIYRFATGDDEKTETALLSSDPRVVWAELNYTNGIPRDPEGMPYRSWKWGSDDPSGYVNQSAFSQVGLVPAQATYQGDGIVVAVLDTGIDLAHPAFSGKLVDASNLHDMISDDAIPQDGPEPGQPPGIAQGHGTHVSGIISHIAPNARLMPIRVLDANGRGNTFVLAYAIDWAVQHGADVINLSLGTDFESSVLSRSIRNAIDQGVVVVAAAGNENVDVPQYPAAFDGVVGVTAVDSEMRKATFSNYGTGWVDLSAPGVGITSTVPMASGVMYAAWSGTSMATPFASGAAALARQKLPFVTVAQLTDLLVSKGDDLDTANPAYDHQLGRQIDISAALVDAPDATPSEDALLFLPTLINR